MASDKSKVAEAYAEVRADTSQLPKDIGKVPNIITSMLSLGGMKGVSQLLQGNITGFAQGILGAGYEKKAEVLKAASEASKKAAQEYQKEAQAFQKTADAKKKAAEKLSKEIEGLRKKEAAATSAIDKKELQDKIAALDKQAQAARKSAGKNERRGNIASALGDSKSDLATKQAEASQAAESLAQKAGMLGGVAIKIALVAALAAIKAVSSAAHTASENLKTDQMVRATGKAAGWSAEQLIHMRDELRKTSSFGQSEITGAQQALMKNQNVKGLQFPKALQAAADLAARSGEKLESVASEVGEALGEMGQGGDGANKAISLLNKYGATLSTTEQAQLRAMSASREYGKAQDFLLGKLDAMGKGNAAEAANTGAGGFEKLKNSVEAASDKIFGITGGIGALAAKVGTAIDAFMELPVVQDALELVKSIWDDVTGSVSGFISENGGAFREWGSLIMDTGRNVIDHLLSLWQNFKAGVKVILDFIGGENNETWGDIKDFVTSVLVGLKMVTANFGLSVQLAWNQIKLGAVILFDAIEHGFEAIIVTGMAAFKSLKAGWDAIWDGKDVGAAMSAGFKKAFDEGMDNIKDSDAVARLKAEAAEIRRQMGVAMHEADKAHAKIDKARADKKAELEKPKFDGKNGPDHKQTTPFKFEFTGFEEMSKKIQTSLYPSEALNLQKAGVAAAEKAVDNGGKQLEMLRKIADGVMGMGKFV